MANTAEVFIETDQELEQSSACLVLVPEQTGPVVRLISDVEHDRLSRLRYEHWMGITALKTTAEVVPVVGETSLLESARQAKKGSLEAMRMVDTNVNTAVAEACFKDDYVGTGVETWIGENGERIQYGQSTKSVQHNALMRPNRHEKLVEITQAETLNDFRIDDAQRAELLKDHYLVIASIVPAGVPEKQLGHKGDGYFLEDLTLALQITTESDQDLIVTTPIFTAGVEAEEGDSFEDKMAKRHDIAALTVIYKWFRLQAPATAAGFIKNGLLIPKGLMPNGPVDFLRWFHMATDEVLGRKVERKPEDYIKLITESKKREASLSKTCAKVKRDLLAAVDELKQPMEAIKLLWKLVKKHTVQDSVKNKYIDPRVFGKDAAPYIRQARHNIQTGNIAANYWLMQRAHETAHISTCGGGDGEDTKTSNALAEVISITDMANQKLFETSDENCVEVKDGQTVDCPDCGETVKAIVPNRDGKIYCSNPDCDSAHPSVKRVN